MAFNRTYYFDIRSNNNISYRLEIYDDVETSILDKEGTLGAGGVKIKYGSEGSKMFAPLKPSTLTIDMMVTDTAAANYIKNLKTLRQERDVYVGLYRETVSGTNDPIYTPMWGGYLLMDLSAEPDVSLPYNIKLKFIDGLASLKHYDFIPDTLDQVPSGLYDKEDTYIANSQSIHRNFVDLISICLSKSGYFSSTQGSTADPQFKTAVNWYNGEMANTTDDPLAKTRCKPNIFYEAETQGDDTIKYKAMNCYDVLVSICKAWGMRCFLWRNTWYFIQINQWEENQTGTQSNPDDIDNHKYNMAGSLQSTNDTIEQWWGMYQLFVDNSGGSSNIRNYKLSGGQYGTLPAFKQVTIDFLNVDNFNSFTEFPPIPLTSTSGAPTTTGTKYEFTSLGNFTFDGTTNQMFYQRIYLALTNNGTESGDFNTEWCMVARPSGTGTNTANTSPVNNGWTIYMYFDYAGSPQTHAWAPTIYLSWASWPCTGQYPIVPGNQTIDITTGTPYQFPIMPASTFTAGDWEIGYYVRSTLTTITDNWSGHGRFNPTVYSANKNPWDYNIAYQNVAYGYGIGSSEFAPIVNGAVGSYSTTTSLVQTGDDTADEQVKDILFGDGFGGRGQVQIYTGTIWKNSDQSGIWGKNTLAGGNSMSQQLAQDIFAAQSKSLVEFNVATTLDPTESIYFNDGTANRPQFICPFTKINTPTDISSGTPAKAYIMHTGEWNVIKDTWKWKLYEQMQSLGSITTTTNTNGGLNSGNTGGAGIPAPSGGGPSAKMGNPAANNTLNTKFLQDQQIAPITTITEEQYIVVAGATGTYAQTITSLKVNALEEIMNAGDKFILQTQSVNPSSDPGNRIEFEVSTRAMAGATTILVTSQTIYQNILIGDTITFNTSNLVSQYQNKTEGTIAGFDIDENGIAKSGIEITGWLDSDTMVGATANNVPTAESVKAYVDASSGGGGTALTEFAMLTCAGTTITSATNGDAAAVVMKFDRSTINEGADIIQYDAAGKTGITDSEYCWEIATSTSERIFEMQWNVTTDTNTTNNRILSAINLQSGSLGGSTITWTDINPSTSYIYDRGVGTIRKGSTAGSVLVKIAASATDVFYRMIFWKEASSTASTKSESVLDGTQITIKQLK
jgi:hypothetical protein